MESTAPRRSWGESRKVMIFNATAESDTFNTLVYPLDCYIREKKEAEEKAVEK